MARTCQIAKTRRPPKYRTRAVNRCGICGRVRAVYRRFKLCRLCFRKLASRGDIPGVRKASW